MNSSKYTKDSSTSSDTTISSSSNVLVTLRRMKIEETSLAKDINKNLYYPNGQDCKSDANDKSYLELKKYCNDLKLSLIVIRDLYEEVKANTISEDNLQMLDINDVKKDILRLENKIQTMKAYLQSELSCLKNLEKDLVLDVHEQVSDCNKMYRKMCLPKPKLNEMVLSPVKVLISSPFKCFEVQQFQNFMKTSKNRYGGWNAYHHNIFEQVWRKHFGTAVVDDDCDIESWEKEQKQSEEYSLFLEELLHKIPGMSMKDFIDHHKWYTKYITLKNQQKKALDRWREKKELIKKHRNTSTNSETSSNERHDSNLSIDKLNQNFINSVVSDEVKDIEKTFLPFNTEKSESSSRHVKNKDESKQKMSNVSKTTMDHRLRYLQHTAQSASRCNSCCDTSESNLNIENIQRLAVPVWRLHLQLN